MRYKVAGINELYASGVNRSLESSCVFGQKIKNAPRSLGFCKTIKGQIKLHGFYS